MSNPLKPMEIRWTAVPANNGICVLFDSTRGPGLMSSAGVLTGSSFLAPGPHRGLYAGYGIRYTIRVTGNNCTGDEQIKTANAGASTDWETQGATGTYTITAGTTVTREFKPMGGEWRLILTAGATAPTTVFFEAVIYPIEDWGN